MIQKECQDQGQVPVVMLTHEAREADVQKALEALAVINQMPVIA